MSDVNRDFFFTQSYRDYQVQEFSLLLCTAPTAPAAGDVYKLCRRTPGITLWPVKIFWKISKIVLTISALCDIYNANKRDY